MQKFRIVGGLPLRGEIEVSSAKNSVLPIIAATILCNDECIIENSPDLEDVNVICDVLRSLNVKIESNVDSNALKINSKNIKYVDLSESLIRKMRASFLVSGPLLSKFGKVRIHMPGGCNIGIRPVDLHLKGLKFLGADIYIANGYVEITAKKLIGRKIHLDFPSVGATENLIMASTLAEGQTVIENAAKEPEVIDLVNFINKMGGNIEGHGTSRIVINGVKDLKGVCYTPIYDIIESGTYFVLAAITKGMLKVNGVNKEHLAPIISKFFDMGLEINFEENYALVDGNVDLRPINLNTLPHPGFPTDMQPQFMTLLSLVHGTSIITETIFENRFMHAAELCKMGANISVSGKVAVVEGVSRLCPSNVKATDLRAGAALLLAALSCDGCSEINYIYHIDRGYSQIENKLRKINANITRVDY